MRSCCLLYGRDDWGMYLPRSGDRDQEAAARAYVDIRHWCRVSELYLKAQHESPAVPEAYPVPDPSALRRSVQKSFQALGRRRQWLPRAGPRLRPVVRRELHAARRALRRRQNRPAGRAGHHQRPTSTCADLGIIRQATLGRDSRQCGSRQWNTSGLTVSDLDRSVAFYRGLLGVEPFYRAIEERPYLGDVVGLSGMPPGHRRLPPAGQRLSWNARIPGSTRRNE